MYDEIESHNVKISTDRSRLKQIKTNSIKDLIYSHRSIPHIWKNKFSYKNDVLHAIQHDKNFLNYLARSTPKTTTTLNKSSSLFNIFPKTYNDDTAQHKQQQLLTPLLNTTQNAPQLNNTYTSSHIEQTSSYYHKLSTTHHDMYSIKDAIMHDNKMRGLSNKKDNNNEKDIDLFLEEYKSKHSLEKKFNEICTKDKEESGKDKDKERYSRNIKINGNGVKYKDKKNIFNGSLYSQIVPNRKEILSRNEDVVNGKEKECLRRYNSDKGYSRLKDNKNERATIEISNKFIRNNLETINYYGPHFSYCSSCKNKNFRFYNELEPKQCLDFIHIIKKMKMNKLNINN